MGLDTYVSIYPNIDTTDNYVYFRKSYLLDELLQQSEMIESADFIYVITYKQIKNIAMFMDAFKRKPKYLKFWLEDYGYKEALYNFDEEDLEKAIKDVDYTLDHFNELWSYVQNNLEKQKYFFITRVY